MEHISFDRRFRGPLTSANGGYAAGSLATFLDAGPVEVTLRLPPPLERPLAVRNDGGTVVLLDGAAVVAEARAAELAAARRRASALDEAEAAAAQHVRLGEPGVLRVLLVRNPPGSGRARDPSRAGAATRAAARGAVDCPRARACGRLGGDRLRRRVRVARSRPRRCRARPHDRAGRPTPCTRESAASSSAGGCRRTGGSCTRRRPCSARRASRLRSRGRCGSRLERGPKEPDYPSVGEGASPSDRLASRGVRATSSPPSSS